MEKETDVAFFQYPTSLFRLPLSKKAPRIRELSEGLRSELDLRYQKYKRITLACHSLGGLVGRKYLLEEIKRGQGLRVDQLLLYAVPNDGSALASLGSQISWRHGQLIQLCRNSEFLEELNTEWDRLRVRDRLEVAFIVASQDRVVDKHSAVSHWGERNVHVVLDADHVSLVKPSNRKDLAYMILRHLVLGPARVFLSVGGGRSQRQEELVAAIRDFCLTRGINAKTVDAYTSTNRQPLKDIEYRMERCYGAIVIAHERLRVESGVQRRGAPKEQRLENVRYPTIWNQIEAAMAYTRGLPLLVIAEHGLESEGLLESKYDWRVKWVDMDAAVTDDPEFQGIFEDWRSQVFEKRDGV